MKRNLLWGNGTVIVLAGVLAAMVAFSPSGWLLAQAGGKSASELEKEKALANPYPNDLGPNDIDDIVKDYPAQYQEGYKLLKVRCAQCHQPARPLNSRFVEPDVPQDQKDAWVAKEKKEHPDMFKDSTVWQIEGHIWERYVKRMMSKPGCKMEKAEAKKIWQFLVYDSSKRKLGANAAQWKAHRAKLVEEFKAKYPKRYKELSESTPIDL